MLKLKNAPIVELETEFLKKLEGLTFKQALYVLDGVKNALLNLSVVQKLKL